MDKQATTGPMLMPQYVGRFACTGGECPDTCCSGWRIDLDRTTLLRYETCEDPELQPLFSAFVVREAEHPKMQACGHIRKLEGPGHYCPFLDEAKLCRIQARYGEAWLSDTCSDYPRSTVELSEFRQLTLQLSCPEAARLALLEPDAFEWVAGEAEVRAGGVGRLAVRVGISLQEMEEVRTQMIQILLTPEVELSRRLAIMGLFCLRLKELIEQGKCANLPGLIGTIDAYLLDAATGIPLRPEPERQAARMEFAWVFLLGMRISELPPLQRKVIDAAVSALGIHADGRRDEAQLRRAAAAGPARLAAALQAAPMVLEHYLLNEALRELFPWAWEDPHQHFIHFLLRFTLLRVLLVGRAAAQEAVLTPVELAETVQVFCRRMQNGKKILDQINPEVTGGDWTSLGTLFTVA